MCKRFNAARVGMILGAGIVIGSAAQVQAADLAVFDAAQYDSNGFTFDDFGTTGAVDTSGGFLSLNITDSDGVNGVFGGAGSDFNPDVDFDVADTQLEVTFQVGAANLATAFRVVLVDIDTPLTGDEFFYEFDISSLTPADGFVTLTNPMLTPLFSQPAYGKFPGDEIQNYGLSQIQVQSVYESTGALVVDIESVKIVDPNDPTIARFDADTYNSSATNFTFGAMSAPGAVDTSGANIIIDSQVQAGGDFPGTSFGGMGFNLPDIDFEATEAEIAVSAKLLTNNEATSFRLQLSDGDPGGAGDDFVFVVDAADLNATDFTEVVIPLGSGTESEVLTTFGMSPGDLLQNFDLIGMQIQVDGDTNVDRLNIEVESFVVREATAACILGDLDCDGVVGLSDLALVLNNWDAQEPPAFNEAQDAADADDDGIVALPDLALVLNNWDNTAPGATASAVPEPGTLMLLGASGLVVLRRKRQ